MFFLEQLKTHVTNLGYAANLNSKSKKKINDMKSILELISNHEIQNADLLQRLLDQSHN